MAKLARLIRESILKAYEQEKTGVLHDQLASFRKVLMNSLTVEQFADMYAQTVCYGLFAAKCNASLTEPFSRIQVIICRKLIHFCAICLVRLWEWIWMSGWCGW